VRKGGYGTWCCLDADGLGLEIDIAILEDALELGCPRAAGWDGGTHSQGITGSSKHGITRICCGGQRLAGGYSVRLQPLSTCFCAPIAPRPCSLRDPVALSRSIV